MKNSKILLIIIFLLGCTIQGNAQSKGQIAKKLKEKSKIGEFTVYKDLLTVSKEFDASQINKEVANATVFDLNRDLASEIIEQSLDLISIEITDGVVLDLYRETDAFSSLTINTSDGREFDMRSLKASFYRGMIRGNENSLVSLSLFENEVAGFISYQEGNLVLGKLKNNRQIILYNDKNLRGRPEFSCEASNLPMTESEVANYQNVFSQSLTFKCVRLSFETMHDMFHTLGSAANVATYVTNLYNQVATIYANDGISTAISNISIWVTADPYNGVHMLDILPQFWAHTSSINGDLAQLLTFRDIGGGVATGYSGICNSDVDQSLSVIGRLAGIFPNVPTYSWSVYVCAHEFGHLMGSHHTHDCVWNGNNTAIDACAGPFGGCPPPTPTHPPSGGTIMSYCQDSAVGVNFANGFGPQPTAVMTNIINNGTCLTSCVPCPTNLVITTNVLSLSMDYRQAFNTITATNVINNSATGIYHAGTQLVFQNGFNAATGSDFRAYIEGCTDSFVARQNFINPVVADGLSQEHKIKNMTLTPNPNNGLFTLNSKEPISGTIQIIDLYGTLVYETEFKSQTVFEINIHEKPKGMYVVKVLTDKANMIAKIIKN
ncbi:hypothetical protein ABH942_001078 [Flavobacterium sp. 28YEA47A]|uniref:M12 family metallo-peptidase n=1 Tax=Flavobacterium sp. 28YEA47A TaxID=3156276 RepID=UPI003513D3D7